jgi:UDP-2,3-diacylglucosamine hydrolase
MKKTYFLSDMHLGIPAAYPSRVREQMLVRWLEEIAPDAGTIYFVGDLFDFWHEYRTVVPRGYTRFLGQLARMRDQGIDIQVFTGNHDLWVADYFQTEFDIPVHKKPIQVRIGAHDFFIGHGDGLGPADTGYKLMKKVFTHPLCQWAFRWLHPDVGMRVALGASRSSRKHLHEREFRWNGAQDEWLVQYCLRKLSQGVTSDFFIFGHRHIAADWLLPNQRSRYINLGDWMHHFTWAEYDGSALTYHFLEPNDKKLISNHLDESERVVRV